ncbi:hypothetical protein [Microbacterium sp.]|uniref:hypothetical protein n=1 Tax=Microbacterium sp. TaxID=51671 RepID=UPI003735A57B
MSAITTRPGTTTVDELLRYAAHRFATAGVEFRAPRMSKLIRRAGLNVAREAIDTHLTELITREDRDRSWDGFEQRATAGYVDPTPALADRNLRAAGWYDRQVAP